MIQVVLRTAEHSASCPLSGLTRSERISIYLYIDIDIPIYSIQVVLRTQAHSANCPLSA